jgi:hypothetical protein
MIGRRKLNRLLVLYDRSLDVHLDGLVAFVREVDGFDVATAAAEG